MFLIENVVFNKQIKYPTIHIPKQSVTFISGASGCGKSTLLKLLNKTLPFETGSIMVDSITLQNCESIALRKRVKLISQKPFLFKGSIEDNFQQYHTICESKINITQQRMQYYLQLCLAPLDVTLSTSHLSGGEIQRIYIAICLSMSAEVLLLDEPTSALDFELAIRFMENIIAYAKQNQLTLVLISHDDRLIERYHEYHIHLKGEINDNNKY